MKRRDFLKILGACIIIPGIAVVAVKVKPERYIKSAKCYGKHGRHCTCNSCVEDMVADCLPSLRYKLSLLPKQIILNNKQLYFVKRLPA